MMAGRSRRQCPAERVKRSTTPSGVCSTSSEGANMPRLAGSSIPLLPPITYSIEEGFRVSYDAFLTSLQGEEGQ